MSLFVLGATGFTGSLICQELLRQGKSFVAVARSQEKLDKLVAQLGNPQGWNSLCLSHFENLNLHLSDYDTVINTVGPFDVYSRPFLPALLKHKKLNYVDVSGEIRFVKWLQESCRQEHWTSCVVPSCAFESYLSDMMMKALHQEAPQREWQSLESYYHTTPPRPSPGTRRTMQESRQHRSFCFWKGQQLEVDTGQISMALQMTGSKPTWATSVSYPEIIFWHEEYKVPTSLSFHFGPEHLMRFAGAARSLQAEGASSPKIEREENPFEERWRRMQFEIWLHALEKTGQSHTRKLSGLDPYGLTARIALNAALTLDATPLDKRKIGFQSPAQVFEVSYFENLVKENQLLWEKATMSRELPEPA